MLFEYIVATSIPMAVSMKNDRTLNCHHRSFRRRQVSHAASVERSINTTAAKSRRAAAISDRNLYVAVPPLTGAA
jgi:hypothetical protein